MSHRPRHAKIRARHQARHAKPGRPGPAAVAGAAAKAVPACLAAGAAGSTLMLSGTSASAATVAFPSITHAAAVPDPVRAPARRAVDGTARTTARRDRHRADPAAYTVIAGDTLSRISLQFCGTAADYASLATASRIPNPNLIYPGQVIRLACHRASVVLTAALVPSGPSSAQSQTVTTEDMSAFEACVISRESAGNPRAVNAASGAGGLFQFLPSTWAGLGYAGAYPGGAQTAPVSVQESAFARLYAESGTSPWAPYDGC
jgi:hypothetical protein